MAIPPDELFQGQERAVGRYADARSNRMLRLLETARKELSATIADTESFTARRVSELNAQIEAIMADLRKDIRDVGESATDLSNLAIQHVEAGIAAISEKAVTISINALNVDVLRRFSLNELKHIESLLEVERRTLSSILFTKVGVKGENPRQVARRLAGPESQFAGKFGHIENILRTEASTVYNAHSLDAIKAANADYDLGLNKRIVETIDAKRNHPISSLLNGMVQDPNEKFKVRVSDVEAKARALGRGLLKSGGVSGVFWPIKGGFYEGERLPAHFRERGIVVPTEQAINVVKSSV